MLSSTKRRILNIICVSLAIVAMGLGLGMKYSDKAQPQDLIYFESATDADLLIEKDSIDFSNPYVEADPN